MKDEMKMKWKMKNEKWNNLKWMIEMKTYERLFFCVWACVSVSVLDFFLLYHNIYHWKYASLSQILEKNVIDLKNPISSTISMMQTTWNDKILEFVLYLCFVLICSYHIYNQIKSNWTYLFSLLRILIENMKHLSPGRNTQKLSSTSCASSTARKKTRE